MTSAPQLGENSSSSQRLSRSRSGHGKSLPVHIKSTNPMPRFKQPPIDMLFWRDYKPGMDVHTYVKNGIQKFNLEMPPLTKGKHDMCTGKTSIKLFPYQTIATILASPYSPLKRLLVVASTGTGKSCILVGIANQHVAAERKHGIVFVGATSALYTNFIKQSMECPGRMREMAMEHGWTDSMDTSHVRDFASFMRKYIYPLDYVQFGNMLSGKYKKYAGFSGLSHKVVLLDEAHYLVDSMDSHTLAPTFANAPASWRSNLRVMYRYMSDPTNLMLKHTTIVGATATPANRSIMELFALVNMFAHTPMRSADLKALLKRVSDIETHATAGDRDAVAKLVEYFKTIQPIVRDSVTMYMAKTRNEVLDTSLFPEMRFKIIDVPMAPGQKRLAMQAVKTNGIYAAPLKIVNTGVKANPTTKANPVITK